MNSRGEQTSLIEKKMAQHSAAKIALIIATLVVFIIMIVFNALGGIGDGTIFLNSTGDVSDKFSIEITPAGWTFTIWGFIYAWQGLWLIYVLTTICRRKAGTYVYLLPVFPVVLFIFFILNNIFNVAWLFAWDRQELVIALPLILLTPITLMVCLFFSFKRLYDNLDFMIKSGLNVDVWLIRFLIQNGIAFYTAWVIVASLINVALVLTYKDGSDPTDIALDQDVSSSIALGILGALIIAWFSLDIFVFDKYTRFLFSPYITWTVALAGVVEKNYDLDMLYRNSIIMVVLLAIVIFFLVSKVVVLIVRQIKSPIQPIDTGYKPTV